MASGDERSTDRSTETETSAPVIKVCGSTGVDVALKLETTEAEADRKSPHGAWATGRKSEANGVSEQDAPVSKTIGRAGATESEVEAVGAGSTTADAGSTVAAELTGVAVATAAVKWAEWMSPMRVSNR